MDKNFWKNEAKKWKMCFLAPMDWYGDSAYRQTMRKIAPHIYLVSEFYSADWLFYSKFLADSVLPHNKSEDPLVIQIFGKDPEKFAEAAKIISLEKYNIAWIDVNMWCTAKKVVKSWHWSSLIINECTAFSIISELDKATHLPISVKTRLWFETTWENLFHFVSGLEKAWAKLVSVHGRTAKQSYFTWNADFTNIYELKKRVSIPIICNWDILNFKDWMEKVQNLDWFMIWRGSFWNPWCFLWDEHNPANILHPELKKRYSHLKPDNFVDWIYHPDLKEILETMEFHAKKLVETKWEVRWSLEIRKHLVQYLNNFPWVKTYRKALVTTDSLENSLKTIEEIRKTYKDFLDKRPSLWEITKESLGME